MNNIKTIKKLYCAMEERYDKDGNPYTGIYVYLTPTYSKYVKDVTKAEKELMNLQDSKVEDLDNLTDSNVFESFK